MKAPISMCLITKNDPFLEKCVASFRDYVSEIVIVDTGSTPENQEIAKKLADIFEVFTDCNDPETGSIENFSLARQRSFDLATQDWVCWCDSDDLIENASAFANIVNSYDSNRTDIEGIAYLFPYEYSYNEFGRCNCRHYRERLIFNKRKFHWTNPVHEVCIPNDDAKVSLITIEDITYKHQRQYIPKTIEPNRNLRILRNYFAKVGDSDPRQMYYLGLECSNAGLLDEAIGHLTKYIELSGWDDERAMAALKLIDIYQALGRLDDCLKWAFKTVEIKENWCEGYFALAKIFYFLALKEDRNEQKYWQKIAHFAQIGFSLPPTKTLLFIDPQDRDCEIHRCYNMALNKLGNVMGALESVNVALKTKPKDNSLLLNKKLYEAFLARNIIMENANLLKNNESINDNDMATIFRLINNQPIEAYPAYKKSATYPKDISEDQFPQAMITPHSQAWGIPPTMEIDDLPLRMTKEQLQSVTIMMWKQYILHDELLSAISFLENAPYDVRDTNVTQEALNISKKMVGWLQEPSLMQKHNAPLDVGLEVEFDVPLPGELSGQSKGRFDFIASFLPNNKVSIVDFGCSAGMYTNRLGLLGHEVYGLDLVEKAVALANKKAIEFNTGAKHIATYFQDVEGKVPLNYFDYAISTDTYEHVIDPVKDIFLPAKKMIKPGGSFLMSTPYGSWMRGNFVPWAIPWNTCPDGRSWLAGVPRNHLIAPSAWSVAKHLREAGFYVNNCYASLCDTPDVKDQGNVFAEAHVQFPSNYPGLDVIFFIGDGVESWTPKSIKKTGMGGSETAACQMAKLLAGRGHRVRVYSGCGEHGEGIYDGVEYYHSNKYKNLDCDVLVVSRRTDMLNDKYNIKAKLKLLWVHDIFAINATNECLLKADKILALSEWHKKSLIQCHNLHSNHVLVTRNGIDLARFDKTINRNRFKAINSSSPDRSWPILLECWPKIKERVPNAELHLYYGFKNWEFMAQYNKSQSDLIDRLKAKIKELKHMGVVYHDRINQDQLAEEFLSAGCWIYPTWFQESSCISAMEAQASGLRIISSSIAALNETVADRGVLIDGDWTTIEYQTKFIDSVVAAMNKEDDTDRIALQIYANDHFSWNDLVKEWEAMFHNLINCLKSDPLLPYEPTMEYK